MKLFNAQQTKAIDEFTIANEPISSIELMERASEKVAKWIIEKYPDRDIPMVIFCGPGNNGGDGLAVGRMLSRAEYEVTFHLLSPAVQSADNQTNWSRVTNKSYVKTNEIRTKTELPNFNPQAILIDALFGYGLNRRPSGLFADTIKWINKQDNVVISIDIPSGLMADQTTEWPCVHATHTLTFEYPKLALLVPENQQVVGHWEVLDIGLHPRVKAKTTTPYHLIDRDLVKHIKKRRQKFDHKGVFGHANLICGQKGKIGAACLAAKSCMRSGVGLLTVHIPKCGAIPMHTYCPEAMLTLDEETDEIANPPNADLYSSVGIGCGLGTSPTVSQGFKSWIKGLSSPCVFDADALNIIANQDALLKEIPEGSILTPHPGEFRRLFGSFANDFDRLSGQRNASTARKIYIILKGAHTSITTPTGEVYFNQTGNPGMATAGSGDALTGLLTGIWAQGYDAKETCLLGVYLHGLAGDLARVAVGEQALIASDIINHLGQAWQKIDQKL